MKLDTDNDALALWDRIAPTGDDWSLKLDEIPDAPARTLAIALLRGGNFTCMTPPPQRDCVPKVFDVDAPKPTATHKDPCLRRLLALWSLEQLEPDDVAPLVPAFRTILAIPPPESQLIAGVLETIPDTEQATLLELFSIAYAAGHHDLVNSSIGKLDEPLLKTAVTKHHIDGALEILSAEGHRPIYLAAITDEKLGSKARMAAIVDLVAAHDKLPADIKGPLAKAAASKDCAVAAAAARAFAKRGDTRFVPKRPASTAVAPLLRSLCVLASYEALQESDEPSLLPAFVPAKGLERVNAEIDTLSEVDADGDGDPHTVRTAELVPKARATLPELDDLARAMKSCKTTATTATCTSHDRHFHFVFRGGLLARLEVAERASCPSTVP